MSPLFATFWMANSNRQFLVLTFYQILQYLTLLDIHYLTFWHLLTPGSFLAHTPQPTSRSSFPMSLSQMLEFIMASSVTLFSHAIQFSWVISWPLKLHGFCYHLNVGSFLLALICVIQCLLGISSWIYPKDCKPNMSKLNTSSSSTI